MSQRIHYEYVRPGRSTMVFDQWLVEDRPDVKIMLLERHDGPAVEVGSTTVLEPGAPAVWFVFPGAWYDVGRFHLKDGTFTGWYANLCTPVSLRGDTWTSTDLFLDYWVPAGRDRTGQWLDEDEFVRAVREGTLDPARASHAADVRQAIEQLVDAAEWPPEIARTFTLEDARARK